MAVRNTFLSRSLVFSGVTSSHSFLITEDQTVYAFGKNTEGQCGLGFKGKVTGATKVPYFDGKDVKIRQIACGDDHSLFLTATGTVLVCGSNAQGQLGIPGIKGSLEPRPLRFFSKKDIVNITCGGWSCYCVSSDGSVYSWGRNNHGQLGDGTVKNSVSPIKIRIPDGERILRITSGFAHVAAMSENSVFTFGFEDHGRLGRSGENKIPMRVEGLPEGVDKDQMQVLCGADHTTIVFNRSMVYSFGYNFHGELGIGNSDNESKPVRVPFFEDHPLRMISLGCSQTIALLESHELVRYGYNMGSRDLGMEEGKTFKPTRFEHHLGENGNIAEVVCGGFHTMLITTDGTCYRVGRDFYQDINHNNAVPVEVMGNVGVIGGSSAEGNEIVRYILNEQTAGDDRTTNCVITVTDDQKAHTLYVNRELVDLRFGKASDAAMHIETGATFTNRMKHQLLVFIYGDVIEIGELLLSEVVALHDILTRYGIGDHLAQACEQRILGAVGKDDGTITVFSVAHRLGNEPLMVLALEAVRRRGLAYLGKLEKKLEERGEEFKNLFEQRVKSYNTSYSGGEEVIAAREGKKRRPPHHGMDSIESCMAELFERKEEGGDVVIVSKEDTKDNRKEHKAHKFVLIAKAPYFRYLFQGNWKESLSNVIELEMPLGRGFEEYLRWLYTEKVDDPLDLFHIYKYLDYFNHGDVMTILESLLEVNQENYVEILKFADEMGLKEIEQSTINFIVENAQIFEPRDVRRILRKRKDSEQDGDNVRKRRRF